MLSFEFGWTTGVIWGIFVSVMFAVVVNELRKPNKKVGDGIFGGAFISMLLVVTFVLPFLMR